MTTGTLQIKMLSDWHIGSGIGRPGNIDRLIQRDTNNLPYIPAKSLTGIWRDGCELVAQGLDADRLDKPWQQWVNWLFGEQQPEENRNPEDGKQRKSNREIDKAPLTAKLSVRSAHFSEPLQNAFLDKPMLQSMTAFVKPGVRIDPRTGSALADCLRFEEMARAGAVLEAEYGLELDGLSSEQQQIAKAILVAGALMVERLGAKRRRGAGRCQMNVTKLLEVSEAIAALEKTQGQLSVPPPSSQSKTEDTLKLENKTNSGWWQILLEVTTQSPVIIHQRTVGNHQETQDYIPGTYFVPVVLKHLGNYLKCPLDNALMHGDIVITNANPVVAGARGEKVPFALFETKAKTATATLQQRIGEEIAIKNTNGQQLKGIRQGYVCLNENNLHRISVNREIATHNTIADAKQRPDSEVGGIYTYAAIPAGLSFRLEIRIQDYLVPKDAVNPLEKFLTTETPIQIGRTKKDDYGSVKLKQLKSERVKSAPQSEAKNLTVWLLSDLLLRDERLRPTVDPQVFAKQLGEELGITLTLLEKPQAGLPPIDRLVAFARSHRTESWQTRWGLPRPTLVGLSAGTILQFSITDKIDPQKLQTLKISGFGERTAEGYGQLRFNPALLLRTDIQPVEAKGSKGNSITNKPTLLNENDPGYEYARLIERETWREMMRRVAGAIATDSEKIEILKPLTLNTSNLTSSKLSTLRSLVDSLNNAGDTNRILTVIARMEAKDKWKGATVNEVKQLVENSQRVWQCYQEMMQQYYPEFNFSHYRLTTLDEHTLKEELWTEAVRVLVDACVRAHKRASEKP